MTRLPLGLGVVLVVTLAVLPVSARAQSALVLDPARTYPLYAIGPIQRNGGAWMPPGTFVASRRASAFERQSLRESLALRGDPRVQWVVRAQPQIDEFDLIDPKTGVVERGGMRVPFDRRPIHDVDPTLPIPPDLLDGTPFEIRIVTSTEVRVPMLAARSAVRAEDDGTRSVAFLLIGFYLAVGLVFGLLFISLRERQLIVYAIVLLSLVAFEAINKGYAWQYLWPQASLEWHVPNALAFWAYYAALVIFCSFYLSSIGRLAIFRRAAIVLLALNLPAALSGALIHDLPGVLQFEQACNTALLVELLVWATLAWRAGQRSARFYTIAFAGVFVGVVVNRLALDQYIPHVAFTEWIFEIGILWEVVWLARAVAGYLNDTARENALLHAAESQLQYLVNVDGLTGVANRRGFDERLEVEWKRAARARTNLSLLLVDVDHFKQFNDSCGHVAGDDCLRAIARTLAAGTSRASDFCARYGGEEFAVLAAGVTAEDARQLGERLRQDVLELAIPHGGLHGNAVTISVGVATCTPAAGSEPADLVAAADSALYDAKRGGRNAVVERAMA